jgi:hypothetical protein
MSDQQRAITRYVVSAILWSWYSMTSEELADQVTRCVESLRSRIMGTGDEQYSRGTEQSIETKSGEQIVLETLEELDDAIVYLAHLRARLGKLAQL